MSAMNYLKMNYLKQWVDLPAGFLTRRQVAAIIDSLMKGYKILRPRIVYDRNIELINGSAQLVFISEVERQFLMRVNEELFEEAMEEVIKGEK